MKKCFKSYIIKEEKNIIIFICFFELNRIELIHNIFLQMHFNSVKDQV
jgi:hypothetical protein